MAYVWIVVDNTTKEVIATTVRKYDCVDACLGRGFRTAKKPLPPEAFVYRHRAFESHTENIPPKYLGTVQEFLKRES